MNVTRAAPTARPSVLALRAEDGVQLGRGPFPDGQGQGGDHSEQAEGLERSQLQHDQANHTHTETVGQ